MFRNLSFEGATDAWGRTEGVISDYSYGVDFYNILLEVYGFRNKKLHKALKENPKGIKYCVTANKIVFYSYSS